MVAVARGNEYINGVVPVRNSSASSIIDKFCHALGGKKPIHSILIANNGMAAVNIIQSIRTWAHETFGTEKATLLVAMAAPEDMRINAEHIRMADQFVEVPVGTNNNNYANVQLILVVHNDDKVRALFKQIIDEGPITVAPEETVKKLEQAARRLAKCVNDVGAATVELELDDPSAVRKAEPFSGGFPVLVPPTAVSGKVHQRFAASSNAAQMILAGYEHNIDEVGGRERHACGIVHSLFEEYLSVEGLFSDNIPADVIECLRLQHKKDLLKVVDMRMAKTRIPHKRKGAVNECMEALVSAPLAVEDALVVRSQCSYASEASVCSGDEDQAQERIKKLTEILREHEVSSSLRAVGVEPISCEGFTGVELGTLPTKGPISSTSRSTRKSLTIAIEELELNPHNATLKPDHAHMYLYIVREQQIHDLLPYHREVNIDDQHKEANVEMILTELAHEIHDLAGVRMHRLNVCEWEVKLWISSSGQANGSWRFVGMNGTGHTCTVHAFSTALEKSRASQSPVTDLACAKKQPIVYLAVNSGARFGVAEEVKACFGVGWSDDSSPENRSKYLCLTPEDYSRIGSSVIAHELKLESKEDGLGVENLSGSGAIAGAYSRAYKETFTLTFVTGRTVGIGAYLACLGMQCIQRLDQPILLTSSHMQLGGPKIMAPNGVVHVIVADDLEGTSAILKWLSYVLPHSSSALPILRSFDPPARPVEYMPETCCDPRAAICGTLDGNGKWLGGIFDKDSFVETLEGWARTVVAGRAKLGGIPVSIVAVETQTMMQVIPADPCQLDCRERVVPQARQVWFPDSATNTAQALLHFNREELPLFIIANWRGFSGGQRDLFEGILQAGTTIVENLRTYKQPVSCLHPHDWELRGGAWVVVDSQINSDHIDMYADRTAKAMFFEPEGMIEIEFRTKELLECMGRLDQQLISLKERLDQKLGRSKCNPYMLSDSNQICRIT
ncbi:hypothetical protein Cgig2_015703 [Carnegiea gigantea]|uniref:Acetyl-CoA carboxylase n=1 Tax=Carnegiea gigantea TaxID=171969 RepID=A0A9Q1GQA1_9CARY|nr:hypothetical protein Cgig2_015703 [Carnegiea gigantea]